MNNQRRKAIIEVTKKIELAAQNLRTLLEEEQEYYDNMPENLQGSERGMDSESAQDCIESAIESLEDAVLSLEEID